jgi:protocatechuate 3,4-dioxygenase alpha subunit
VSASATTSSQTVGPFFKFALDHPAWSDLTAAGPLGERVRITGRVLDGDGEPVPDALLEIWQANAAGKYAHPNDTQDRPLDANFRGFGRTCVDDAGRYTFVTIVPGSVPDAHGHAQAPHVNVSIFARGLLKRLVTRVYFSDRKDANENDPLLRSISDAAARATLIAARDASAGDVPAYHFDIVLQGARETVFLDV